MRKIQLKDLTGENISQIIQYYHNHTLNNTAEVFNISRDTLKKLFEQQGVSLHDAQTNELLKHLQLHGYDKFNATQIHEILEYYKNNSTTNTCEHFSIKKFYLLYLLEKFNIEKHPRDFERKHSNIAKYGSENPAKGKTWEYSNEQRKKIIEKIKNTKQQKYGDPNYNNIVKAKQTCLEKYGVENSFAAPEIVEKIKNTKQQKYGDPTYTNREKSARTCKEKYGVDNFLSSEYAQEKLRAYNQKRYGTDYAFQSKTWQDSIHNEELYKKIQLGFFNKTGNLLYKKLRFNKEESQKFIEQCSSKTIFDLAKLLEISYNQCAYWIRTLGLENFIDSNKPRSHYEDEIVEYIGKDICKTNVRDVLPGLELDIYVESKKLAIEFNGNYWHSSLKKPRYYHQKKSQAAEALGIRLIHIWEYEWKDPTMQKKLKELLDEALGRITHRIYARNCTIKVISNSEAKILNDAVHLQGHRNAQVTYGLFYQDTLVQLMSFSKTRYNKNLKEDNDWEIIRGCPGSNYTVVGGVSKLFKHFILEYNPTHVFSYCDYNKFNGISYEILGMHFIGYTAPDMKWWLQDGSVLNRNPKKHSELKKQATAQLFGAGSKKYLWTNEK